MPANVKTVRSDLGSTGLALVMDVYWVDTGFWYDFADGEFRAIPATQNVVVTEPSPYRYSGSTLAIGTAWTNGLCIFRFKTAVTFIPVAADIQEIAADAILGLGDINTKTTNLPTDPADESMVEAAITAAQVAILAAQQTLTRYSGTLTADGTEQDVKELIPAAEAIAFRGLLDLSNMVAGDTVVITEYYTLKLGGAYRKIDSYTFTGLQTAYPVIDLTPRMPNRYGLKITLQQTATGIGGYKAFDRELYTGE